MANVDFHSVEAATVDGHDDPLQIDQIVLAQRLDVSLIVSFIAIVLQVQAVS